MNKTEMIEAVASETGLAKTEVAKVLNAYREFPAVSYSRRQEAR